MPRNNGENDISSLPLIYFLLISPFPDLPSSQEPLNIGNGVPLCPNPSLHRPNISYLFDYKSYWKCGRTTEGVRLLRFGSSMARHHLPQDSPLLLLQRLLPRVNKSFFHFLFEANFSCELNFECFFFPAARILQPSLRFVSVLAMDVTVILFVLYIEDTNCMILMLTIV